MKQIVLVTTSFPDTAFQPGQEAAGTFVADFAKILAKYRPVRVVAPSQKTSAEEINNLTIHRFAVPSLPLSLLKPAYPNHWPAIIKTIQAGQRAVETAVTATPTAHIFALWALPSGYWAWRLWRKRGIPYSTWALGSDIWSIGKVSLVKGILCRVLVDSYHNFADGYKLADDVRVLSGRVCNCLSSSRHLSIATPKKLASAPPYKLAFLGRWHPHKGIDLLLDSLNFLTDEDWQRISEIRIYGGGPLAQLVKTEGAKLRENGRPITIGRYLDREEATELYHWADYLLIPSRFESIPVIFSDAMQTNCPVVAMPVGDLPRLLTNNQVGVLAEQVTSAAFATALQKILCQTPTKYSLELRKVCQQFNVSSIVSQFLEKLPKEN